MMVATLGMSVQHKVFIPSWFVVREKVFEQVPSITADFGLVRIEGRKLPHQNRLCFSLLLSFAEAKESRGLLSCIGKKAREGF